MLSAGRQAKELIDDDDDEDGNDDEAAAAAEAAPTETVVVVVVVVVTSADDSGAVGDARFFNGDDKGDTLASLLKSNALRTLGS